MNKYMNKLVIFYLGLFVSISFYASADENYFSANEFEDYRIAELKGEILDCRSLTSLMMKEDRYRFIYEYEAANKYQFSQCRTEIEDIRAFTCNKVIKNILRRSDEKMFLSEREIQHCSNELEKETQRLSAINTVENIFKLGKLVKFDGYDHYIRADKVRYLEPYSKLTKEHYSVKLRLEDTNYLYDVNFPNKKYMDEFILYLANLINN